MWVAKIHQIAPVAPLVHGGILGILLRGPDYLSASCLGKTYPLGPKDVGASDSDHTGAFRASPSADVGV